MNKIIYKFTIICDNHRMRGHNPFYVGQHVTNETFDEFLSINSKYWGSGRVWNKFINSLIDIYKSNWRTFIKREILYFSENLTDNGLDILEKYYIKKEKAHISYNLGGCNICWGAPRRRNSIDSEIMSKKSKEVWHNEEYRQKMIQIHIGLQSGEKHPLYGRKHSAESIKKMSESHKRTYQKKGKYHLSESHKKRISESHIGERNPMWGKKTSDETKSKISKYYKGGIVVTNGVIVKYLRKGEEIPEGFVRGRRLRNA